MKERYTTCRILTPVHVIRKAVVDDFVTITTTDTTGATYEFRVTAVNNAPGGSNTLELSGRIVYCGFAHVKAKIWIRNDERATFGIDDNDLARVEQEEIARRSSRGGPGWTRRQRRAITHEEVERLIEAHGKTFPTLKEIRRMAAAHKAAGFPWFIHEWKNRTLALDQAVYAGCAPVASTDYWSRLRKLVLAARIGSTEVPSYRDELCEIVHELWDTNASLNDIQRFISADDVEALVWSIWRQNPESARSMPRKRVYKDEDKKKGSKYKAQLFLFREPSQRQHHEIGFGFVFCQGWELTFTHTEAFEACFYYDASLDQNNLPGPQDLPEEEDEDDSDLDDDEDFDDEKDEDNLDDDREV